MPHQDRFLKHAIEANNARYRDENGVYPFFTLTDEGVKYLAECLKSNNIDLRKNASVPINLLNDFLFKCGLFEPQTPHVVSTLLGAISSGYSKDRVKIDIMVLEPLLKLTNKSRSAP